MARRWTGGESVADPEDHRFGGVLLRGVRTEDRQFDNEASAGREGANWFAAGAALCVITHGAKGAVAWRPGRDPIVETGRPVEAVDTVGAGDSFHAALLARLDQYGLLSREGVAALDDAHVSEVLAFAVTAAAITCSRRGADPPRLAEMPPNPANADAVRAGVVR
jgi:fructokinase